MNTDTNLIWFNKEGDSLNIKYNDTTELYEGDLLFHQNSSGIFKTIGLYTFESIPAYDYDAGDNMWLKKFQLFNEYGFRFYTQKFINEQIDHIEASNKDASFYSKWIYGDGFERKFPKGTEVFFNSPLLDITQTNKLYTVLETKKDAILILTQNNNEAFNTNFSLIANDPNTYINKTISAFNGIGICDYLTPNGDNNLSIWNEPYFYSELSDNRKITVVGSKYNDGVYTINKSMMYDRIYPSKNITRQSYTNGSDIKINIKLLTDLPIIYNDGLVMGDINSINNRRLTFLAQVPSILKPGVEIQIPNSINPNKMKIAQIDSFIGTNQLKSYNIGDQVIWNSNIYQCILAYDQGALSTITPANTTYWTRNITYLNVDTDLIYDQNYETIYLTTNLFSYESLWNENVDRTLAEFSEKFLVEFALLGIDLKYINGKLSCINQWPENYTDIQILVNNVDLSFKEDHRQKTFGILETLQSEYNYDISENYLYNLVIDHIDQYGLVVKINGLVYNQEVQWVKVGNDIDYQRTLDKTIRTWLNTHSVQLFLLGIDCVTSNTGSNLPYYNTITFKTTYPNVPFDFEIDMGSTALYHIEHSNVVFYDMGSELILNINNRIYSQLVTFDSFNTPNIPITLLNWIDNYQETLSELGIYVSCINNMLKFDILEQDQRLDYTINVGREKKPGVNLYVINKRIKGNDGVVIASNKVILTENTGSTYSFLENNFSTGMITGINNTIYNYDNQEYNILQIDDENMVLSYQGPFWGTTASACRQSPFMMKSFTKGFMGEECQPELPPPVIIGGGSYNSDYSDAFSIQFASTNIYNPNFYIFGNSNVVDFKYAEVSENVYIFGEHISVFDSVGAILIDTIILNSIDQIDIKYNRKNNYLYALSKNTLYVIDPIINSLISTIPLAFDAKSLTINDFTGDVYVTYENETSIEVYFGNTGISISTSTNNGNGVYNSNNKCIYIVSDNTSLYKIDSNRNIVATLSIPGLNINSTIYYSEEIDTIYVFGNTLYKIKNDIITQISTIVPMEFNDIYYDPSSNSTIISQGNFSDTNNNLSCIDPDNDSMNFNISTGSFGYIQTNLYDNDVYISSLVSNSILIMDILNKTVKYNINTHDIATKLIYNKNRRSIWGLQPSSNSIIEIEVYAQVTLEEDNTPYEQIYGENQYGTLSPDYIRNDFIWLHSRQHIRYPRRNYMFKGEKPVHYLWKWEEDNKNDIFLFDFSGDQLENSGSYAYTGPKPLSTVVLNNKPNRDITKVSMPEYQQTIFSELVMDLNYIDSSTDLSYLPSPMETFIGYSSQIEGPQSSNLLLVKREDVIATYISDEDNYISIEDVDGEYGIIRAYNDYNFMIDINDDSSYGFKVGQNIQISFVDNDNRKNKYYSQNNNKVVTIRELYNNSIIVDYIDDIFINESSIVIDYPSAGEYTLLDVTIKVVDKTIGKFKVSGQTEIEDIRYRIELSNEGKLVEPNETYIFKEYDINEQGIDWRFLNQKRKEMLMVKSEIYPYVGSYKAIINAINYFGYNDLILSEYYRNINVDSPDYSKLYKVKIPEIFDNSIKGWNDSEFFNEIFPNENYEETNLFNLSYRITDELGNITLTYTLSEVLVKLQGLKKWLEKNVIPLTHKIKDITGVADIVQENSINHKSYNVTILNIHQDMTPVDFAINEAYLMPINSGSTVYNVVVDFTTKDNFIPDYFTIKIRTYKTYKEWLPFLTYNIGDIVSYYGRMYKSNIINNKINNPRKYENVSEWVMSYNYVKGSIIKYNNRVYNYIGDEPIMDIADNPLTPPIDIQQANINNTNPNWLDITIWEELNYVPVQTINEYRTKLNPLSFTVDTNIDPFITIEVTSDNGYGLNYGTRKNYEIRSTKDLTTPIRNLDPLGPFEPIQPI